MMSVLHVGLAGYGYWGPNLMRVLHECDDVRVAACCDPDPLQRRRMALRYPGVAPVAMQEGKAVAHTIAHDLKGEPRKNFHYFDKGSLATIGRSAGIAQFGKVHISGFIAWLSWLFVHIFFLIGFRNRLIVMIQWAWSYFTYERGARLITGDTNLPGWTEDPQERAATRAAD